MASLTEEAFLLQRGDLYISLKNLFMDQLPHIRSIEPVQLPQTASNEAPRFLLQDSARLSPEQVVVTLPGLIMIELADGSRTTEQIALELRERTGLVIQNNQVCELFSSLDQRFLLDNTRARVRLKEISPRPMRHSGSGYPDTDTELEPFLDDLLAIDKGPTGDQLCRASILPHIDFFRGRDSYREGYRHLHSLKNMDTPLTVVVLGISHAFCRTPFILTRKDFDTPLGVVETDQKLVEQLSLNLPFDPHQDEYNHMGEHSVEFHAVLLKRLMGSRPFKIVPVLCRSFFEAIQGQFCPLKLKGVTEFLRNLEKIRDEREDVHFLASVDLAHMGVNFGGPPLSRTFLEDLERRDRKSIEGIAKGQADAFFETHQADLGERNYCGTPAIYTLLKLFPQEFEIHRYQQCSEPDLSSTVTICSATLRDN